MTRATTLSCTLLGTSFPPSVRHVAIHISLVTGDIGQKLDFLSELVALNFLDDVVKVLKSLHIGPCL
jgi:hypothetical protein